MNTDLSKVFERMIVLAGAALLVLAAVCPIRLAQAQAGLAPAVYLPLMAAPNYSWQEGSGFPQVRRLVMVSPNEGWAVDWTSSGSIVHYYDHGWTALSEFSRYNSVAAVSPDHVWAVGDTGRIAHYDGTAWQAVISPTTAHLLGVGMVSADEGWAVGDHVILHYLDGIWSIVPDPGMKLFSVAVVSKDEAWAVGYNSVSNGCGIAHYTGGVWQSVLPPVPCGSYPTEVFMVSESEGWATGGNWLGMGTVLLHYVNGTWAYAIPSIMNLTSRPYNVFSSFSLASETEGWAIGADAFLHFQDGTWTAIPDPTGSVWNLRAQSPAVSNTNCGLVMISPTEGYAWGYDCTMQPGHCWQKWWRYGETPKSR